MKIPYGRQNISDQDIECVLEVLRSDYITQGPQVPAFERKISQYCKVKQAVAVNNATSALYMACLALGVQKGDRVWTSPISFVASANCVLYCDGIIDFVEIDERTFNIDIDKLEEKLVLAEKHGILPKVIIPVHLCGLSCDMEKISMLSKKFGFRVIEDASHAIGGSYKNEKIGNCRYSDITVFSFHPVKIITTGEGGIALSNDKDLIEKMRLLRSHGVTREEGQMTRTPDGPWFYQQIELGFNFRLTDLQAALGSSQLERIDIFIQKRHDLAKLYTSLLKHLPLTSQYQPSDCYSSYHLYVINLEFEDLHISKKEFFAHMNKKQIGVNVHYIPIHLQPYYEGLGFKEGQFPVAENYYKRAVTLPLYPDMNEEMVQFVVDNITSGLKL